MPWPARGTFNWDIALSNESGRTPKLLTGNSNAARSMFAGVTMLNRGDYGNGVVVGVDQARGTVFAYDPTTLKIYNGRYTAPAQGYSQTGTPTGVTPYPGRLTLVRSENAPGGYYAVWFGADTTTAAVYKLSWDLTTMTKVKDLTAGTSPFGCTIDSLADGSAVLVGEYGDPLVTGTPTAHIWRSTDYGSNWTATYTSTAVRHIHAVAFDPYNSGHAYATTGDGDAPAKLLWSTNNGATWSEVSGFGKAMFQGVQISFSPDAIWLAGDGDGVSAIVVPRVAGTPGTPSHAARNSHFQVPVPGAAPGDMFYSQAFHGAYDATTSRYYFVTTGTGDANINNYGNRHGVFYIDQPGGLVHLVSTLPNDFVPGRVWFYDDGARHMLLAGNLELDITNHIAASSAGSVASTDITDSTTVGRAVLTAVDAAAARTAIGAGTGGAFGRGMVDLDSFSGANDTAKLSAAMSYCSAQTYTPLIALEARDHTFTSALGKAYDGFGMVGANRGWGNAETSIYRTRLNLTIGANSFLDVTGTSGQSWNWYLEGFDIRGSSTATLVTSSGSGAVLWASTFRDITVQGLKGVFGNGSSKLLTDLITIDGQWEILNCTDTYVNIGGADNRGIFADGGNFGCGSQAPPSAGTYQMIFGGMSKSNVGPVYITADNGWRGMKLSGSSSSGYGVDVRDAIVEGRNNGSSCDGNLILITGGAVNIWGGCVNDGMVSPTGSEHGLIEINGTDTQVSIMGTAFAHSSGVSGGITCPVIYATGTAGQVSLTVSALKKAQRSSNLSWSSQMPRVQQTVTGLVLGSDSTIDLYTHA